MKKRNLLDQMADGFTDAVKDIREKLMEGWFGAGNAPAAAGIGASHASAPQSSSVHRTNIDLSLGDNTTVDTINLDMRQQNVSALMRSWDDVCAEVGPVRGIAPDKEPERGLDL